MVPDLQTLSAAIKIERELTATRADRLAPMYDAASEHRSASAPVQAETPATPWGRVMLAVRSLHVIFRPAHA